MFSLHHLLYLMCLQFGAQLCNVEHALRCLCHIWPWQVASCLESEHICSSWVTSDPYHTFSEANVTLAFMRDPGLSCLRCMSTLLKVRVCHIFVLTLPDEVKRIIWALIGSSSDSLAVLGSADCHYWMGEVTNSLIKRDNLFCVQSCQSREGNLWVFNSFSYFITHIHKPHALEATHTLSLLCPKFSIFLLQRKQRKRKEETPTAVS